MKRDTLEVTTRGDEIYWQARPPADKDEEIQGPAKEVAAVEAATSLKNVRRQTMMSELFHKFAVKMSKLAGSPWMFVGAVLLILSWGLTGPVFHFSDTWQLVINTGTTIITFLMVFLIQNTQSRESEAIQLKLDELIRAVTNARTRLVDLEELSEGELEHLHEEFRRLREQESHKDSDRSFTRAPTHGK